MLNLSGQRFGTLEVVRPDQEPKGAFGWICRCEKCGVEGFYSPDSLRRGKARCSCDPRPMGRPDVSVMLACVQSWQEAVARTSQRPQTPYKPKTQTKSDKQAEARAFAARAVAKLRDVLEAPQLAA